MRKVLTFLFIFCYSFIQAQEASKTAVLDGLLINLEKAHSNLSDSSYFKVENKDTVQFTLDIKSSRQSKVDLVEESFTLDLKQVSDVFMMPVSATEYRLIVSLKSKLLIKTKKVEYENLFHGEVTIEDLREEADLWIIFSSEQAATTFEMQLIQLKKLLNSN